MSEHNLSGLEHAIYLKSNLLRKLAATAADEWPAYLAEFTGRLVQSDLQDATALVVLLADLRAQIGILANAIAHTVRESSPLDEGALTGMSRDEVLAWFHREWRAVVPPVPQAAMPRSRVVNQAVNFIDGHYPDSIRLDAIANAVGVSRRTLVGSFRREMKQSIHEYLTHVRLHRGMALIRQGQKIEAVSLMVGYRSRKNFYRHFKAAVGMTPLTYRLTCLQQPSRSGVRVR